MMTAPAYACPDSKAASNAACDFGTKPRLVLQTAVEVAPIVQIWQCGVCGHGVTRPAMPDVAPLYAARESDDFLARDSGFVSALKMFAFKRLARSLLKSASGAVRRVADYGTGNGMLVRAFSEVAKGDIAVCGFDFFQEQPALLDKSQYCDFAASGKLLGEIDLLTCFHVLEHSDDSDAMITGLMAYLRPGGTLVIEVPNIDCVWTPWFGEACANWYAPYHRVHFSRRSLRALVERHGLELVSQNDICGPTFALSLASLFGVKPNSGLFLLALMLRPVQWAAERVTRRPSALRIIVRDPRPLPDC